MGREIAKGWNTPEVKFVVVDGDVTRRGGEKDMEDEKMPREIGEISTPAEENIGEETREERKRRRRKERRKARNEKRKAADERLTDEEPTEMTQEELEKEKETLKNLARMKDGRPD